MTTVPADRSTTSVPRATKRNVASSRIAHLEREAFTAVRREECAVITVAVELDLLSLKYLDRAIARTAVGFRESIVDLRACAACDSASLAMLAKYKYVRKERLQLVVSGSGSVRKIFEITGLGRSMALHATLEEALATLRSPRSVEFE